jgi:hypothetical protein
MSGSAVDESEIAEIAYGKCCGIPRSEWEDFDKSAKAIQGEGQKLSNSVKY